MSLRPFRILLVEDNANDILIIRRALEKSLATGHDILVARDGQEALDMLVRGNLPGHQSSCRQPDLVLLDLNLPRIDGYEVLQRIKSDPELRHIPVVVLTTSERDEDVVACYRLGANTFVPKPVEFERFAHAVGVMYEYWRQVARVPRACRHTMSH